MMLQSTRSTARFEFQQFFWKLQVSLSELKGVLKELRTAAAAGSTVPAEVFTRFTFDEVGN